MPQVQAQQKLTTCRVEISYFPPWKYLDRTVLIRLFGYLVTVFESVGECQASEHKEGVSVSCLRNSFKNFQTMAAAEVKLKSPFIPLFQRGNFSPRDF